MSDDWTTRQTLLLRVKNPDDEQAWDEFVSYYQTFIKAILKYLNAPVNELEDLTQDILVKIWKALQKLDYNSERARFRTWLNRVIRNSFIDSQRAKNRRISSADSEWDSDNFPIETNEFSEIIDREWRAHITNLALSNIHELFSGNAMEVFNMYLDEVPAKEISERLDIAESSVYKLRSRVEQKLVQEVKRLKAELEF